jgi:hypothetical protein
MELTRVCRVLKALGRQTACGLGCLGKESNLLYLSVPDHVRCFHNLLVSLRELDSHARAVLRHWLLLLLELRRDTYHLVLEHVALSPEP